MTVEIRPELAELLHNAYYVWFTTVRDDGMPQPTPVWFVWEDDNFLIYSMPNAQKVANIKANNKVALSFTDDSEAGHYVVVMGEARIDPNTPPVHEHSAYVAKYETGIRELGMTPESMGHTFSAALRVTPLHVRGE